MRVRVRVAAGAVRVRASADRKELFLWCEVLVLMDRSLLQEGRVSNSLCPECEGSVTCPGEMADCSRSPSLQSGSWSLPVAVVYQMVMEEVRIDSMMAL